MGKLSNFHKTHRFYNKAIFQRQDLFHVERIHHNRLTKKMVDTEMKESKRRCRSRKHWVDVKSDLRSLDERNWKTVASDKTEWKVFKVYTGL